ncbi:MAG: methylated-DNA--[protein]-cysteine S-methyltransferase [Acidimicrobiales bacterium]
MTNTKNPAPNGAALGARLVVDSPIGPLVLDGDDSSITHLHLPNTGEAATGSSPGRVPAALRAGAAQLAEYFAARRTEFSLPLAPTGTAFQVSVWRALADIPYGGTITYGELARYVGRPLACRAVGQANGANPLPIFYPCHRVVAAGGRLGGYGGGLDVKRELLEREGVPTA